VAEFYDRSTVGMDTAKSYPVQELREKNRSKSEKRKTDVMPRSLPLYAKIGTGCFIITPRPLNLIPRYLANSRSGSGVRTILKKDEAPGMPPRSWMSS
jgi:hypothetical protein